MLKPKEMATVKTPRFDPHLEIHQYTDTNRSSNGEDSLLLTPNKQTERQTNFNTNSLSKKQPEVISKSTNEFEALNNQIKKKRETFFLKLNDNAAKYTKNKEGISKINLPQQKDQINPPAQQMMEIEPSVQPEKYGSGNIIGKPMTQVSHKETSIQEKPQANSSIRSIQAFSAENEQKLEQLSRVLSSSRINNSKTQPMGLNESLKQKSQKLKKDKRRVTQDLRTLLNLNIFNQNQQNLTNKSQENNQKEVHFDKGEVSNQQQSFINPIKQESNLNPQTSSIKKENLIDRAVQRLSGGKCQGLQKKERVTLNPNEIFALLSSNEVGKQGWLNSIESIKKQIQIEPQLSKDKALSLREQLRQYVEQTNHKYKSLDQKAKIMYEENKKLQQAILSQEKLLQYLDYDIDVRRKENQKIIQQTQRIKKQIDNPEQFKNRMTPINYIESNYNIRVIFYQIDNKSETTPNHFIVDFTIDRDIYCRIKKIQNNVPTIQIRSSYSCEVKPPQWTIDMKLRIEALGKYFKLRLEALQPMDMLIHLGQYYEQLQLLENDIFMIEKIYELNEVVLNSTNDKISFKLEINYELQMNIYVNLLNYQQPNFFQITTSELSAKRQEDNYALSMEDSGKQTLIEFITSALEKLNP